MGTYVKRSCAQCRTVLQNWTRNFIAFGSPFEICPTCGAVIDRRAHFNEWFLMGVLEKLHYVFTFMVTGGIFGGAAGIALAFALASSGIVPYERNQPFLIGLVVLCAVTFVIIYAVRFVRETERSIARSKDPQYVRTLQRLGFLDRRITERISS